LVGNAAGVGHSHRRRLNDRARRVLLGVVNAIIRPIAIILTLPLTI